MQLQETITDFDIDIRLTNHYACRATEQLNTCMLISVTFNITCFHKYNIQSYRRTNVQMVRRTDTKDKQYNT